MFSFVILSKLNILDNRSSSLNYFKEIPFYNTFIEEPKFEPLKKIDLHSELPSYEELNVIKTDHVFKGYVMPYKVELVEKKDPLIQLEASKSSIKGLFNDLLDETKGFKYQITVKILLKNIKTPKLNSLLYILIQQQNSDKSLT